MVDGLRPRVGLRRLDRVLGRRDRRSSRDRWRPARSWFITAERWEAGRGELGGLHRTSTSVHLAALDGHDVRTWPPLPLPSLEATRTWALHDGKVWLGDLASSGFATHGLFCKATLRGGDFRDQMGASSLAIAAAVPGISATTPVLGCSRSALALTTTPAPPC